MKKMTFEQALEKMEDLVEQLEKGTPLDESIKLFQEGIELSKLCHEKLSEVEKQIEVLTENKGEIITKKMDIEEKE